MAGMTDRLSDERLRELCDPVPKAMPAAEVRAMASELLELRQEVTEQLEGMNDLDAVVHILGIEDSDVLPAKRISEILGELERARAAASAGPVMPEVPSAPIRLLLRNCCDPNASIYDAIRGALIAEQDGEPTDGR